MMLQPLLRSSASANMTQGANRANRASGTGNNTSGEGNAVTNSINYDDFLQLLVMQLKYQDPLNPMDNQAFLAQNAQFSTVEQLMAIRSSMETQKASNETSNELYATNMIGKLVAADVSDYNEAGELVERFVTGIVEEVTFLRSEGETVVHLDNGAAVYLKQIVSVRDSAPAE